MNGVLAIFLTLSKNRNILFPYALEKIRFHYLEGMLTIAGNSIPLLFETLSSISLALETIRIYPKKSDVQ